jgi:hypothetical protein
LELANYMSTLKFMLFSGACINLGVVVLTLLKCGVTRIGLDVQLFLKAFIGSCYIEATISALQRLGSTNLRISL